MTYIRNPRIQFAWESDGEYDKPGFKADDGTIFQSANEADSYDKKRRVESSSQRAGKGEK
jgi:hypothetical protein